MTLRRKNTVVFGIMLIILLLLLDLAFTNFLRRSAEQADRERISLNLSRAVVSINGEAKTLAAIAGNWAYSDATWRYMKGRYPEYPETVLNRDVLTDIGISSMIFIGNDYKVRLFKDFSASDEPSAPESEFKAIFDDPRNIGILAEIGIGGISGIVMKGDSPILFSVKPILTSDKEGPAAGYLIVTRAVTSKLIQDISRNLHFSFAVEPVTAEERESAGALQNLVIRDEGRKSGYIVGRMLVKDHKGEPSFWVVGIAQKEDISAAERKLQRMFLLFAAIAVLLCLLTDLMFNRSFSLRLRRLQKEIEAIRDEAAPRGLVTVDSKNDEITSLQRVLNDVIAYHDFKQESKSRFDSISLMVYERFAEAGNRLCYKTLEDIATSFSPGDEKFRSSLPRAARMTERFCRRMGVDDEECLYAYLGALFSRIGLLGVPFAIRSKTAPLSPQEQREYRKYPIISKDYLESVELLSPATPIPYRWNENWDGSGFPHGLEGSAIPLSARIYAIVNEWNELTRSWPGRKMLSQEEVESRIRAQAGTRFDPHLVEEFIRMLHEA